MRASEFVYEATNPTDPPPSSGDPEFEKSMKYFIKIIQDAIRDYNNELKFLAKNNPTEYSNKTTDEDSLRNDLTEMVVDLLLTKGAGNLTPKDKSIFMNQFTLNDANAPFDRTGINVNVTANPIGRLALQVTNNWYENRYTRFTNPRLWARIGGSASSESGAKVSPIETGIARNLQKIIGVNVQNPLFWKKLGDSIRDKNKVRNIYKELHTVYNSKGYVPTTPLNVRTLNPQAAALFARLFGLSSVEHNDFWFEFTDAINRSLPQLINIFNTYYP